MLKRLTHVNLWVHDQDEALAFYTRKVGFEPREDVTLAEFGNYRYLTYRAALAARYPLHPRRARATGPRP